jgi:UPF0755 protein
MKDRRRIIILLSIVLLAVVVIASLVLPPSNFPVNSVVDIPTGSTTSEIADLLYENKIIRSARIFELMVLRQEVANRLQAGFYQFERPLTIQQVVSRLKEGLFADRLIKLTVPEGLSVEQLAVLAKQNFADINQGAFVEIANPHAGYLFPDTYLLPSRLKSEQLIKIMRENFDEQIGKLEIEIRESGRSLEDVIKMASLVEEEAKTKTDRAIIAGILWKRLDDKMRLEVDVATSTYETLGLPLVPIVSPGLESIKATLNPTATPYWFYISDKQGQMHYAKTFAEHKLNIDKYLK